MIGILCGVMCATGLVWGTMITTDCIRAYDFKEPVFATGGEYVYNEMKGTDERVFKGVGYTVEVVKDIHPDFGKEYIVSVEVYMFGKVIAGVIT